MSSTPAAHKPSSVETSFSRPGSKSSSSKTTAKKTGRRALLKEAVPCCADETRALAPRGEYEIEGGADESIALCSCSTKNRFTLSFDAFLQHFNEGRIAVVNG